MHKLCIIQCKTLVFFTSRTIYIYTVFTCLQQFVTLLFDLCLTCKKKKKSQFGFVTWTSHFPCVHQRDMCFDQFTDRLWSTGRPHHLWAPLIFVLCMPCPLVIFHQLLYSMNIPLISPLSCIPMKSSGNPIKSLILPGTAIFPGMFAFEPAYFPKKAREFHPSVVVTFWGGAGRCSFGRYFYEEAKSETPPHCRGCCSLEIKRGTMFFLISFYLLVLSREWMGMGEWDYY